MPSPLMLADALLALGGWLRDFAEQDPSSVQVPDLLRALDISLRVGGCAPLFANVVHALERAALEVLQANEMDYEGRRFRHAATLEKVDTLRRALQRDAVVAVADAIDQAVSNLRETFPLLQHLINSQLQLAHSDAASARATTTSSLARPEGRQ